MNSDVHQFKVIIEKYEGGYVAYPVGLNGAIVGQGDTYDEAVADISSAIEFHIETFGADAIETEEEVLDATIIEVEVSNTGISVDLS